MNTWYPTLGLALALQAFPVLAQQGDSTDQTVRVSVFKPQQVPATPERVRSLQVPEGFEVAEFARDLGNVRIIATDAKGRVYVTRRESGDVLLLRDDNGDGRADGEPRPVAHRAGAHGIALHDGRLYLATVKEIFVGDIAPDGSVGELRMLLGDLPDGGQHPNRTLAFGPDGMLYASIGSSCNACNETNPEHATLLRIAPDGKSRTIFAHGLRNTIGFAWHPTTGELWGMDHGIDFLGDDVQPEELNLIARDEQYGWPHVFGRDGVNPQSTPPGGITKSAWKAASEPMLLGYTAHAAPMQMLFYTGNSFPAEYRGDAFVTMRGSWNRKPASGYEVVRVRYRDGKPQSFEPFLRDFLDGERSFGRPVGLAQTPDGALLVGDDANGVIYRVAYDAKETSRATSSPPASAPPDEMKRQAARGVGVPLALQRDEARAKRDAAPAKMFSAFADGEAIPLRHSEYADGVSPPLRWSAVDGARSYVLIMEDPDAKPITPFVHWVAWNIPADTTMLPEGLQEQARLPEPEGLMQGRNSRGTIGYLGPRPPVGDPPHHYHFQLFALDTKLELPVGADRDRVLEAMRAHVIAKSRIVGTFQHDVEPLK